MGVYARGSRERPRLWNERYGGELVRALSQGRERRAWENRQEPKMRRGRGRRVVCEWCGNCWQGSKMASITDGR